METKIPTVKLNNGLEMPCLNFGTWMVPTDSVGDLISYCLEKNINGIDCAEAYDNQKEIGEILGSKIKTEADRKKLFITSKLWATNNRPQDVLPTLQKTLKDLQLTYLDLYLIHWPEIFPKGLTIMDVSKDPSKLENSDLISVWKEMEKLVESGLVKSIGVSNHAVEDIEDLIKKGCKILPAVNQIEYHPYLTQEKLFNFCKEKGIVIQSYSCLGNAKFVEKYNLKQDLTPLIQNELLVSIGKKYGKSGAQIALKWNIQKGNCVNFKTEKKERLDQNVDIFDFQLTEEEMKSITNLNQDFRLINPPFHNWTKRNKAI